jgi:hypothetical protein
MTEPVDLDAALAHMDEWGDIPDDWTCSLIAEARESRARAATPGPDSRDAEQIIADALYEDYWPSDDARETVDKLAVMAAAALRAAGLLPGPDTITVPREALRLLLRHGAPGIEDAGLWDAADTLRAALSEPLAPKEQQPPPFDPDLELMANREGNRREVRAYRRDAQPAPSDVPEQP